MCLLTIAACVLLGKAISFYFHKSRLVWLSATALALMLPWNFLQGMLFWDATFAPAYIIIGFFAFSYIYNSLDKLNLKQPQHLIAFIAWPLGLVLAATTYKPAAFLAVGCYVWFLVSLARRKIYSLKHTGATLLMSSIFASPAVVSILAWPTTMSRSREISVFALNNLPSQIGVTASNFQKLLSPDFLFTRGDLNPRHSTGVSGMIGFGAIIPIISTLIFAIKRTLSKNEIFLAAFSLFGLFLSFLGSALTVESPPHSLRANCAWIFFVILIFLGLYKLYQQRQRKLVKIILAMALAVLVLSFAYYLRHFFIYYLPLSVEYFSTPESNIDKLPFVKTYLLK
jgi:hypothetical protein